MSNKVVQLKDPQGNNIYPISADDGNLTYVTAEGNIPSSNYALGTVLAWAREVGNYTVPSGNATLWTTGTWTQYGPMKRTTELWSITIQAPADENWCVELDALAPKIKENDSTSAAGIGIAEVTGTTINHRLTNSFWYCTGNASSIWFAANARTVIQIPAGTSKTFAVYTKKENSSTAVIYGRGQDDDSSKYVETGDAVNFKATLIDKEKI